MLHLNVNIYSTDRDRQLLYAIVYIDSIRSVQCIATPSPGRFLSDGKAKVSPSGLRGPLLVGKSSLVRVSSKKTASAEAPFYSALLLLLLLLLLPFCFHFHWLCQHSRYGTPPPPLPRQHRQTQSREWAPVESACDGSLSSHAQLW